MAIWHFRSKRKSSGKLTRKFYRKTRRKFEAGRESAKTTIGPVKLKKVSTKRQAAKTKGGKLRLRQADVANVLDPATQKITKTKILDIVENKANPHFVRLKIITKGAVIKTEAGNAKVTSRPGQHGVVNAVLLAKEPEKAEKKETVKKPGKKS